MNCQTFKALASRDPGRGFDHDVALKFADHAARCSDCANFMLTRTQMGERGNDLLVADLGEDVAKN